VSSSSQPKSPTSLRIAAIGEDLRVSPYERAASLMLALLVLVGLAVTCLFLIWLSNQIPDRPQSVPVTIVPTGGYEQGEGTEGMQLDSPNPQEIAQESELEEPEFRESVAAIESLIAALPVDLDTPNLEDDPDMQGGGQSEGTGDRLAKGEGGGYGGGVNVAQRWVIRFPEGSTLDEYARQLDSFGIELGVLGGSNQVTLAKNLAKPRPDTYEKQRDQEDRLHMSWSQGSLQDADRQLLTRAGVNVDGRIILQFFPHELEVRMLGMELSYMNRKVHDIRRTFFGVRAQGGGYEFFVQDQIPL